MFIKTGMTLKYPNILPKHINRNVVLWKALITKEQKSKLDSLFVQDFTKLQILLMNVEALSTKKALILPVNF